jgi:hypothetical protein
MTPAGAENAVTSRGLHVLVHETAERLASEGWMGAPEGGGVPPAGAC